MLSVPIEVELAADTAKREITAYASVFGNRDSQGMRVVAGAFQKSIAERVPSSQVKLFRDHWQHVGVVRHAEEDTYGLLTVGYVSKTPCGDECLEQVKDGSLSRYSFYGRIVRANVAIDGEDSEGHPIETLELKELKLFEVGPCNLDPANPLAVIVAVKSMGADMLDNLGEWPFLLKAFAIAGREKGRLSADERHVAAKLLGLHDELASQHETLKALLAPDDGTQPQRAAPPRATPANAETADLTRLLESIRARGQIHL